MEFFRRAREGSRSLGILPGTFNPITIAHQALAEAALAVVDEVVFVLPRVLPHKTWTGASFDDRLGLLLSALVHQPRFSIAASDRGLFVEIARECRQAYGPDVRFSFLCGTDAAERIAGWDYGAPGVFDKMLDEFDLLVADRGPAASLPRCRQLVLPGNYREISATDVRERIARGETWEHLVPPEIRELVRRIYSPTARRRDSRSEA